MNNYPDDEEIYDLPEGLGEATTSSLGLVELATTTEAELGKAFTPIIVGQAWTMLGDTGSK